MTIYTKDQLNTYGDYVIEYDNIAAMRTGEIGDWPQLWASENLIQYRSHYDSDEGITYFYFVNREDFIAFKMRWA